MNRFDRFLAFIIFLLSVSVAHSQGLQWSRDGNSFYQLEEQDIVTYTLPAKTRSVFLSAAQLTPSGQQFPLEPEHFYLSPDQTKVLIYTNSRRVWRINTRGDYWLYDRASNQLRQMGKTLPPSSLMFAKFSPDGTRLAYVSNYNLYVEDLVSAKITQLTTDGNRKLINGTFDWVYEEEFACRDGFRWSNDSRSIAFWQIDARGTRDFYMINNTDSVYSRVIPVEYPKVGETPSACRIGVVDVATAQTRWMNIEGNPEQHYIVRMEFIPGLNEFLLQQLNRKQNESKLIRCSASNGNCSAIYAERDDAWVDVYTPAGAENAYDVDFRHKIEWIGNGKEFLWASEKDGWRHLYRISVDGKKETLITKGAFDVIAYKGMDEKGTNIYFTASPDNATQAYLFAVKPDGKSNPKKLSPATLTGTHQYQVSPNGKYAQHLFSNHFTRPLTEWISLPAHKPLTKEENIESKVAEAQTEKTAEFFKIKTEDGIEMDGWMVKPVNFDASKKYPVVFFVYTEPWGANVTDMYGAGQNYMYGGNMREDGYIYISIDNRGTPVPKGREWRKSIYRKVGRLNIRDQAMAAKEILKWSFVDPERVAVWGWSGGGSATLNLMFQYPDIYKTGIAIAAVANQLTYDNIYQERYMGLPHENMDDFVAGSPITHAKNLKGDLLYIHGTGDDNVHFANAEMLINELVKHNKQFQLMTYPNRSHGMGEGEGTWQHLVTLYTQYLRTHCPPGPR